MPSRQQEAQFMAEHPQSAVMSQPQPHPELATGQVWSDRYSRQRRFAPIGETGQKRLLASTVLIVGCGALGASLAQHMVRAGVGTVRIADRDFVEPSNLQRQVLFEEADALAILPKAVAAAEKLRRINSEICIEPYVSDVTGANASELAAGADLILDGTDNAETRWILSDVSFRSNIPLLYGGIAGAQGMSAVLIPGETACLRCLIGDSQDDELAESCDTIGVISPIVDWIAATQAAEALKWLTGNQEAMRRTWLSVDLWPFHLSESAMPRPLAACPYCGTAPASSNTINPASHLKSQDIIGTSLCGRNSVQVTLGGVIDLKREAAWAVQQGCKVTENPYLLSLQVPSGERLVLFSDGRVLVQGTQETERAIALCRRFVSTADRNRAE